MRRRCAERRLLPRACRDLYRRQGHEESVNLALDITDSSSGGGSGGGSGTLELDQADGSTHEIAQGGSKLFKATDPEGDTITYSISNNPSGIGIDSNTGLVVVSNAVKLAATPSR